MKLRVVLLAILAATLVLYLPVILNPEIILNRGNDLQEFFWPLFYYTKEQLFKYHELPLWNNLWLSGTPLLPDPQSPLFYLPNIIFLLLPIDTGFLASFIGHTLLGGVGMFLLANKGFKLSRPASLFASALYILTPKLVSHMESGHFGLVAAYGWLPFVPLAIIKLVRKPNFSWSILLAAALAGLFFTHLPTFLLATTTSLPLFLICINKEQKNKRESIIALAVSILLTFGLTAITLLPQLEWKDHTTRALLVQNRDTYPKWETKREFIQAIFWPWKQVWSLDTEKWITTGAITGLFAALGFFSLDRSRKVLLLLVGGTITIITLNNISPLYDTLITQDWYVQLRVATRPWFVINIIIAVLAGFGLEKLLKTRIPKISIALIATLAIGELLSLAFLRLSKPIPERQSAPRELYEFLAQDKEKFRVFCVTRCIPQKQAAQHNLELVEGYSTLQQKNYFDHFIQLSQVYWDTYTLSLPPFEIYHFQKLQPHPPTLADLNIKYIISPHELTSPGLSLEKKVEQYLIYRNNLVQPRAYFLNNNAQPAEAIVLEYAPNRILIDTSPRTFSQLVLAEVVSPGWAAFLDGKEETPIDEYQKIMRLVNLKPETMFVEFRYLPPGYNEGKLITVSTLIFLLGYITGNNLLLRFKQSKNRSQKKDSVNIRPN